MGEIIFYTLFWNIFVRLGNKDLYFVLNKFPYLTKVIAKWSHWEFLDSKLYLHLVNLGVDLLQTFEGIFFNRKPHTTAPFVPVIKLRHLDAFDKLSFTSHLRTYNRCNSMKGISSVSKLREYDKEAILGTFRICFIIST